MKTPILLLLLLLTQLVGVGNRKITALTSVTLGLTSNDSGTTQINCGFQGVCMVPIMMNSAAGGYTLTSVSFQVQTAGNNILLGIYSTTTGANCAASQAFCAGSKVCATSAQTTPTTGNNTVLAASFSACGTLTASTLYFLAMETAGGTIQLNGKPTLFCPGSSTFMSSKTGLASMAMPATMGSGQTVPSANNCPQLNAKLACVSGCGVAATPWTVIAYTGNANAATVTTANLKTGASCTNGTFGGTLTANTKYDTGTIQGLRANPLCNGSAITTGTVSMKRIAAGITDFWTYSYGGGSTQSDVLFWIYNTGNTTTNGSSTDVGELSGANTITVQIIKSASCPTPSVPCMDVERSGGSTAVFGFVPFSQSTWYAVAILNVSSGNHQVAVFDTTGTQIASTANTCADGKTVCIASDATGNPSVVQMLNCGSSDSNVGTMYYGPVLLDPTGSTFATIGTTYGQMNFPDSPQRIGPVLSKLVHDGKIAHAEIKHGRWYSYALHDYLRGA